MNYEKIYSKNYYYNSFDGNNYDDTAVWKKHFDEVAEKIIDEIHPKTVLDVGCAMGYLVTALRERGVDAYGIDVSSYAISQVAETSKPFCSATSILDDLPESFPTHYDLLVCIEMAEHIYEEDCNIFFDKICSYSDDIIFSSSPDDLTEITHYNVQQTEYWSKRFAKHNFIRQLEFQGSYISPVAKRYIKGMYNLPRIIENYEKYLRIVMTDSSNEIIKRDEIISTLSHTLQEKEKQVNNLQLSNDLLKSEYDHTIQNLENDYHSKNTLLKDTIEKYKKNVKEAQETIKNTNVLLSDYENEIKKYKMDIHEYDKLSSYYINETEKYKSAFFSISNSTFWKLTKPFRYSIDIIRKLLFHNILIHYIKIISFSTKNNGIKITLKKIYNRLFKKKYISSSEFNTPMNIDGSFSNLMNSRFRNLQPIPAYSMDSAIPRLNLVTDSLDSNSLLGGVATALIIATEFARHANMKLRIITRNTPANPVNYNNIIRLSGLKPFNNVEFFSDYARDIDGNLNFKLDISSQDIFFATSWWSAAAIKKINLRNRFFYIIQEVETFFYPHGDEHYLCSQIMHDPNIDYIINSKYLYDYFTEHEPNITDHGVYFDPAFPIQMYNALNFEQKQKYKMFFYSRPNNPRNMFYYGIELINDCIQQGILDTNIWEIYFVGQDVPDITFFNGYKPKYLGLLSWDKYADFLKDIDLTMSLMYTPHPSYPPYDAACSGSVVITNICENKTTFKDSKNIILTDLDKDSFRSSMISAIQLAMNPQQREKNYLESTIPRAWGTNIEPVIEFMEKQKNV